MTGDEAEKPDEPRQRVERARRGRRARLTPAPGTDPAPEVVLPGAHEADDEGTPRKTSPDDDRITRERPPHW